MIAYFILELIYLIIGIGFMLSGWPFCSFISGVFLGMNTVNWANASYIQSLKDEYKNDFPN